MKTAGAAIVVLLAAGGDASAHRLDEYLQATRVSFARDRLTLEVDLTPGAAIASAVAATLDLDRDHTISPSEAEAYGRTVVADLVVEIDGHPVGIALTRIEIPTLDEMRDGLGTMRLSAAGSVESPAGWHRLDIRNNHRPDSSVYMVNALVPGDAGITVVSQSRDPRQQVSRVEYHVNAQWPRRVFWTGICLAGLAMLGTRRRGRA